MHRKTFLSTLLLSSLRYTLQSSIGPIGELQIVNADIQPDGFTRSTVLVNGVFPSPLIRGRKGDRFMLNVLDLLHDTTMETATSIHWHGIFQKGTNHEDGTAWVTQCPIIPDQSFTYRFDVHDQAGTFWYHSHISTQYCDGLRGPLVIYDDEDPHAHLYDIDDESTVITLSDWYHTPSPAAGLIPIPNSTLINGFGRYTNGPATPLAVINVSRSKRYRLRIVAMACHPHWIFSIDGHNFTIIETDGINTQPHLVDSLDILAGQRYSVILEANQPVNNYWIRAQPDMGDTTFVGGMNSAILRYEGAADVEPSTNQTPSVMPMVETDLHPLENPGAPGKPEVGGADVNINLGMNFSFKTNFTINGVSFIPPDVPVLLQILHGSREATELLPKGSVYTLPPNKVIEISFSPGMLPGAPHPFHLHGHAFDVVRSAGNDSYNYVNPVRRDVVNVGGITGLDNTTIRFVTDNAGPWFLHCHIDWHLNAGLAVVMAESVDEVPEQVHVSPDWKELCPTYNRLHSS